ncbi:MAG: hypothetical protein KMY54_07085 [Erysipelothrix sp.]|nr:hypothetical protein [Erysipelothrix sp.]
MREKRLINKLFKILLSVFFIFSSFEFVLAEQTSGADISNVELLINGNPADEESLSSIGQTDSATIIYHWEVDNFAEINNGDYIETTIPQGFRLANDISGSLLLSDGDSVGEFFLDRTTRILRLTFNDFVETMLDVSGKVVINTRFDLTEITTSNPVVFTFPLNEELTKTFEIQFTPTTTVSDLIKSGVANKAINADVITWTIDANRNLKSYESFILSDTYPSDLDYVSNSLRIYKLNVALNGDVSLGEEVTSQFALTLDEPNHSFDIDFESIQQAYRIVYQTSINNIDTTSFENLVAAASATAKATITVARGSLLEKSGTLDRTFNPTEVRWTIVANKYLKTFENLIIKDTLPSGLLFDESSIVVSLLTLNDDGTIQTETPTTDYVLTVDGQTFEIEMGSTNRAVKVTFVSEITNKALTSFTNVSELLEGETSVDTKNATVTFSRGVYLRKAGSATINYTTKTIDWTIDVNTIEEQLQNVTIEDIVGSGMEIVAGSFRVFDLTFQSNGNIASQVEILPTPTVTQVGNEFSLSLGDISSAKRITYKTQITNVNQTAFVNTADMEGTGVPIGTTVTTTVRPTIANTVAKSTVGSINYFEKSMSWRLVIRPTKEAMNNLIITDTFDNKGLSIIPETIIVSRGSTTLLKDTDYTLSIIDNDVTKGFVLTFLVPVTGAEYRVNYKTLFDRLTHITPENARRFINRARFQWQETTTGNNLDVSRTAFFDIRDLGVTNGDKSGLLRKTDRQIDWTINVNYLQEPLENLNIVDTIAGNQELVISSFKINYASRLANGNIVINEVVPEDQYLINQLDESGFSLLFNEPTHRFYQITYTTQLIGHSQPTYTNSVNINDNIYSAQVTFENSNVFVDKSGAQDGSVIDWQIKVNSSLSTVEQAKITDRLTLGHEYLTSTFKVYKMPGNVLVDPVNYTLDITIIDFTTKEQMFELSFNQTIVDEYMIVYQTEINTNVNNSQLGNTVLLTGIGVEVTDILETTELIAVEITEGSGTGTGTRGKIRFDKVDGDNHQIKLSGAVFMLYDSTDRLLGTLPATNDEGYVIIDRISYGSYYLIETIAPEGYQIPQNNRTDFAITNNTEQLATIENYQYRTLLIEKVDKNDPTIKLANVSFDVFDEEDTLIDIITTQADGVARLEGLVMGTYTIKEKQPLSGYFENEQEYSVVLDEENAEVTLTVSNQRYHTLTIVKVDADDNEITLANVEFELYDSQMELIGTYVTDEEGRFSETMLTAGTYYLKETKNLDGYHVNSEIIEIILTNENFNVEQEVVNIRLRTLLIEKVDKNDPTIKLANVSFDVFDEEDTLIDTITTQADGVARLEGLVMGTYTIKEKQPLSGYFENEQEYSVVLDEENAEVTLTVSNQRYHTLTIVKVDADDNEITLANVEFELYDSQMELIGTYVTDEEGTFKVAYLTTGTYYLQETKAAVEYLLNEELIEIILDQNNFDVTLIVTNEYDKSLLPDTSDQRLPIGQFSLILGLILIFLTRKPRIQKA